MNAHDTDEWAPCLHNASDRDLVRPWILALLNQRKDQVTYEGDPIVERQISITDSNGAIRDHTVYDLEPKITERLLWMISDLEVPTGGVLYTKPDGTEVPKTEGVSLTLASDQWVAIDSTATLRGTVVSIRVEGDTFTLALSKTYELWAEKLAGRSEGRDGD